MSETIQEQIRSYVKDRLLAADTLAGENVFDSRILEFQDDDLPAINIWMFDENLDTQKDGYSQHHPTLATSMEIVFVFSPGEDENPGAIRDQFRKQIKDQIDRHLGGLATCCEYDNTQTFPDTEGDRPRIIAVMTFQVEFLDS